MTSGWSPCRSITNRMAKILIIKIFHGGKVKQMLVVTLEKLPEVLPKADFQGAVGRVMGSSPGGLL